MLESLVVIVSELGLASLFFLLAYRMSSLVRSEDLLVSGIFSAPWVSPAMAQPQERKDILNTSGGICKKSSHNTDTRKSAAIDRPELVTQLHILFGLQDRVCRSNHLILEESPDAIKHYAAAWLYGAATALTGPQQRHSEEVAREVSQLVNRKIGLPVNDAAQATATLTRCSVMLACYRNGLEGAEHWLEHHFIPVESALNTAITSNAFI